MTVSAVILLAKCILASALAAPAQAPTASDKALKPKERPPKLGESITAPSVWCEAGGPPGDCLCFKPLPCPQAGCRTYDQEAGRLEKLLKTKASAFPCVEAEVGGCATWRYIYCDAGRGASRLKLYDEAGRLRAERKIGPLKEHCAGKAQIAYEGEVALCKPLQRVKVLHGRADTPPPAEAEDYPFAAPSAPPQ